MKQRTGVRFPQRKPMNRGVYLNRLEFCSYKAAALGSSPRWRTRQEVCVPVSLFYISNLQSWCRVAAPILQLISMALVMRPVARGRVVSATLPPYFISYDDKRLPFTCACVEMECGSLTVMESGYKKEHQIVGVDRPIRLTKSSNFLCSCSPVGRATDF